MSAAHILTGPDGIFALEEPLRRIMAYLDDGRLFVSKAQEFTPHVRGLQARLARAGRPVNVVVTDSGAIAKLYEEHAAAASVTNGQGQSLSRSDMQRAAMDLFKAAVAARASDIHIGVSRDATWIKFRVHGDLVLREHLSHEYGELLCTVIYQAMSDVSDPTFEKLDRQDARISDRAKLPDNLDGIRVATSPQVGGYIMVLRLLYNDASEAVDLAGLGYTPGQAAMVERMKRAPTGIFIISGATGSGKSTTLQRVLTAIIAESRGRRHIITVEDPPEYPIRGATQTPVTNADTEEARSREFQRAITGAMRLDPDAIMIGEMRDRPSAELAVQAAMTGHQVWTTVHANSALSIIPRLINMGIPPEIVHDPAIVRGLINQSLVKRLCPHCKTPLAQATNRFARADLDRYLSLAGLEQLFVQGPGCAHCHGGGIAGRIAVAEVIVTDDTLMDLLQRHDRRGALEYSTGTLGEPGKLTRAVELVAAGLVDPSQAEAILGVLK